MTIQVQEQSRPIVLVTLDHQPRRNAMSRPMLAALTRMWALFERTSYRCIILTGAGERAFCAGADMSGDLHAMALLLTANLIGAATAARTGLVNRVIPREALLPWALETAETIAALSPTAVRAVRQQISTTLAEQALAREALDQALGDRVRASPHFMEDVTALRQKRVPKYP